MHYGHFGYVYIYLWFAFFSLYCFVVEISQSQRCRWWFAFCLDWYNGFTTWCTGGVSARRYHQCHIWTCEGWVQSNKPCSKKKKKDLFIWYFQIFCLYFNLSSTQRSHSVTRVKITSVTLYCLIRLSAWFTLWMQIKSNMPNINLLTNWGWSAHNQL